MFIAVNPLLLYCRTMLLVCSGTVTVYLKNMLTSVFIMVSLLRSAGKYLWWYTEKQRRISDNRAQERRTGFNGAEKRRYLCILTTTVPSVTPALSLIHRNKSKDTNMENAFSCFICTCAWRCCMSLHMGCYDKTSIFIRLKSFFSPFLKYVNWFERSAPFSMWIHLYLGCSWIKCILDCTDLPLPMLLLIISRGSFSCSKITN